MEISDVLNLALERLAKDLKREPSSPAGVAALTEVIKVLSDIKNTTTPAATEVVIDSKEFTETLVHGTNVNLKIHIEISNYSSEDFREILSFISSSSHNFYISFGNKISNKL